MDTVWGVFSTRALYRSMSLHRTLIGAKTYVERNLERKDVDWQDIEQDGIIVVSRSENYSIAMMDVLP